MYRKTRCNDVSFQEKCGGQSMNRCLEQVIHECCKTSIDFQVHVFGLYANVLDEHVCW